MMSGSKRRFSTVVVFQTRTLLEPLTNSSWNVGDSANQIGYSYLLSELSFGTQM
jgi:hypothetical protein